MKTKIPALPNYLVIIFLLLINVVSVNAQTQFNLTGNQPLPPSEEKFEEATDLVSPWRSSGCIPYNTKFREAGCYPVKSDEYKSSDILSLHNSDGSLWYRFSLTYQSPDYFLRDTKMGFKPFATPYSAFGDPSLVILRMVGESPNWYEVEVNEKTRATKFALKNNRMWTKTTWSRWLYEGTNLQLDNKEFPLLDKPNGEIIKESSDLTFDRVKFLNADGDWALVEGYISESNYQGLIRWRKGRELLVGTVLTGRKVPEIKLNDEDK